MLPALLALALASAAPPPSPEPTAPPAPATRLQLLLGALSFGVGLEHRLGLQDHFAVELAAGPRFGVALVPAGPGGGLGAELLHMSAAWRRSTVDRRAYVDVGVRMSLLGVSSGDGGYGGPFAGVYVQPNLGSGTLRFAPMASAGWFGNGYEGGLVFFLVPVGLIINL